MRLPALVVLSLCACSEAPKHDRVIASAERPVQLTVRRHEIRVKPACEETGFNVYKCWLKKHEKQGCVYLDVGMPYDDPASEDPCGNSRPERLMLSVEPGNVDFEVDAEGYRFAWRTEASWSLGYLWNGKLLVAPSARGAESAYRYGNVFRPSPTPPTPTAGLAVAKSNAPIDWRALKSFDDAIPELYFYAEEEDQPQLLSRLRKLGGDRVVTQMLLGSRGILATGWEEAFETLPPGQQKEIGDALVKDLLEGGPDEALTWLDEHPALLPKDFEQRLYSRASLGLLDDDLESTSRWLPRGYKQHHPDTGALACKVIEAGELSETWNNGSDPFADATAYAVVAVTHTKCPAVTRKFGATPCDTLLRCSHVVASGEDDAATSEASEPGDLCDERDFKKLPAALIDDEQMFDGFEAAAKMGALTAQGPLPKAFVLANARRSYALLRPDAGVSDDPYPDVNAVCFATAEELGNFFCKLPPDRTHFVLSRCGVDIDDAHHRVRLTLLEAPDGGVMMPSWP